MSIPPDPRPHRSFPGEGYTLFLEKDGLEIRVDDYHARPLKLSWEQIEEMRVEAKRHRAARWFKL